MNHALEPAGCLAHDAALAASRPVEAPIILERASPDDIKSGGAALRITYGLALAPFGNCAIAWVPRGICHLSFIDGNELDSVVAELGALWPKARIERNDAEASRWVARLEQQLKTRELATGIPPIRCFVRGTAFQVRVWEAMLRVPCGALTTYGDLAKAIGHPSAARAVGSAVASNNIGWIIPCHRVIRGTGAIGCYRWDPSRKRSIISWEARGRALEG